MDSFRAVYELIQKHLPAALAEVDPRVCLP